MFSLKPDEDNIYIVAVTAYTTEMFAKKCFEAGMNEFVTKPIHSQKIASVIKKKISCY